MRIRRKKLFTYPTSSSCHHVPLGVKNVESHPIRLQDTHPTPSPSLSYHHHSRPSSRYLPHQHAHHLQLHHWSVVLAVRAYYPYCSVVPYSHLYLPLHRTYLLLQTYALLVVHVYSTQFHLVQVQASSQ